MKATKRKGVVKPVKAVKAVKAVKPIMKKGGAKK